MTTSVLTHGAVPDKVNISILFSLCIVDSYLKQMFHSTLVEYWYLNLLMKQLSKYIVRIL